MSVWRAFAGLSEQTSALSHSTSTSTASSTSSNRSAPCSWMRWKIPCGRKSKSRPPSARLRSALSQHRLQARLYRSGRPCRLKAQHLLTLPTPLTYARTPKAQQPMHSPTRTRSFAGARHLPCWRSSTHRPRVPRVLAHR